MLQRKNYELFCQITAAFTRFKYYLQTLGFSFGQKLQSGSHIIGKFFSQTLSTETIISVP